MQFAVIALLLMMFTSPFVLFGSGITFSGSQEGVSVWTFWLAVYVCLPLTVGLTVWATNVRDKAPRQLLEMVRRLNSSHDMRHRTSLLFTYLLGIGVSLLVTSPFVLLRNIIRDDISARVSVFYLWGYVYGLGIGLVTPLMWIQRRRRR